jgi:hypothetical protein
VHLSDSVCDVRRAVGCIASACTFAAGVRLAGLCYSFYAYCKRLHRILLAPAQARASLNQAAMVCMQAV